MDILAENQMTMSPAEPEVFQYLETYRENDSIAMTPDKFSSRILYEEQK